MTIIATGASAVGMVFYREAHVVVTDDVVIVQPWSKEAEEEYEAAEEREAHPPTSIDLEYLAVALAQTIAQGGYLYEAKLYMRRVGQLSLKIPVSGDGEPDLARQKKIAEVAKRLDGIRARLQETGAWSKPVRLS